MNCVCELICSFYIFMLFFKIYKSHTILKNAHILKLLQLQGLNLSYLYVQYLFSFTLLRYYLHNIYIFLYVAH